MSTFKVKILGRGKDLMKYKYEKLVGARSVEDINKNDIISDMPLKGLIISWDILDIKEI